MKLVSFSPKPAAFDSTSGLTFINSDLAFGDHYVYQGNFAGFTIWDVSNPAKPKLVASVVLHHVAGRSVDRRQPALHLRRGRRQSQRLREGRREGPTDHRSHMAGVRIFDVSNPSAPKLIKNVQTCKGSHTHTVIPSPKDKNIVYIYVSGHQGARPDTELAGCKNGNDPADATNSLYRLDVIKVPLEHPEQAEVVTGARIFTGLTPAPTSAARANRGGNRGGRGGRGATPTDTTLPAPPPTGPRNCHDVTAYPAMHLLAGACASYGLLVDISNPEKPVRLDALADTNFSLWHTAVFSNDGSKVVFTDEWGGGTAPMCQATSMMEMGGNTILTISADKKNTQHAYFKIPTAQTAQENCVSHNGGLIPVPGRDLMVQGWYQGGDRRDRLHGSGSSVRDRVLRPRSDRLSGGFNDGGCRGQSRRTPAATPAGGGGGGRFRNTIGGSWGAYYWNGMIYSSELARGFDILELLPSDKLSANEIAAAKLVRFTEYNPQSQPQIVWPAAFPVVRSYLDQLVRDNGLAAERTTAIAKALDAAEKQTGSARGAALTKLAKQVDGDVAARRISRA